MMLRTQTALAMSGAVMLTATVLWLISNVQFDGTTLLQWSVALSGLLVASFVLAYVLMRPLAAMSKSALALADHGNSPALVSSDSEFGLFARALNGMAADVRCKSEALSEESSRRRNIELALIDTSVNPVITVTPNGFITTWNPAAEKLYGYNAGEAIGRDIGLIIPTDRLAEHRAIAARALADDPVDAIESVRLAKGGRRIDVALSVRSIGRPSGKIVGLLNITRDITAQKLTEEKFQLAVESCPSGMVLVDRFGDIVLVNSEIERLFGYRRDELLGQKIEILIPENWRQQHTLYRDGFAHQARTRLMGARRDLFGRHKDGTEIPVEVGLNPIQTREGPLILSAIIDISERKRAERLKDEFVSTVSHELRTPLTSIAASLGLLAGPWHAAMPDTAKRLVTLANSNSARLVRLVNDILDFEKIESGKSVFDLKRVKLRGVVEQTIEASKALADSCGVTVRLQQSDNFEVYADADRLTQVITNLLSNAIKFSPRETEVAIAVERRGDHIRTTVRDHGSGVPEAFKPHLFEKFAQADASDAREKGGTGLGLNIVKQIVQRLCGDVGYAAAPDGGAAFYFDLRLAASEAKPEAVVLQLRDGVTAHGKGSAHEHASYSSRR